MKCPFPMSCTISTYSLKNLTLTLLPKVIYLEMHCLIAEIRKKNPLKHERQWNENQKSDSVVPSLYHCIQFFRYKGLTCELSSSLSSYNILYTRYKTGHGIITKSCKYVE